MTNNHRAVIYSNGIADFRRSYWVEGKLKVAIPVKQEHVADVLASLQILGPVELSGPPTFQPANAIHGALEIDSENVLLGLAQSLGGAEVQIDRANGVLNGTLMGLHTHRESNGGAVFDVHSVVVSCEGLLRKTPLRDIEALQFRDPAIQAELDKALQRQVQRIKPNSTFVELELRSETPAEALVQYTIPAAAWKITYRLRDLGEEFEIQGFAIVDNNTDEDWREFELAVVTGDPITFSTDLADSKIPERRHVNVVRDEAYGAIEASEDARMPTKSLVVRYGSESQLAASPRSAMMAEAAVQEAEDFCRYTAQGPVSIDSNRSAVIPVFTRLTSGSRGVLYYDETNHATRAFRAIQFLNETGHSLGRGVCTVYEDDVYAGNCIVPATKPGHEALLPHTLDTALKVRKLERQRQRRETGLKVSQGIAVRQASDRQASTYAVASSRDQAELLIIDHIVQLSDATVVATCTLCSDNGASESQALDTSKAIERGVRLTVEVPPLATLEVVVEESSVMRSQVVLAENGSPNFQWLRGYMSRSAGASLADHPDILECLRLQQAFDEKTRELEAIERQTEQLKERQERLRKNLSAASHASQSAKWLNDLEVAEERLVDIEDRQMAEVRQQRADIDRQLYDALKSLSLAWSDS